jgi:hypothetical protein
MWRCRCGSPACRGVITPAFDWLNEDFQTRNYDEFAWFIKEEIDERRGLPPEMRQAREEVDRALALGEYVTFLDYEIRQLQTGKEAAVAPCPALLKPFAERLLKRRGYYRGMEERRQELLEAATMFCFTTPVNLAQCGIDVQRVVQAGSFEDKERVAREEVSAHLEEAVNLARVYTPALVP